MTAFGIQADVSHLTEPLPADDEAVYQRRLEDVYRVDETGQVLELLKPDGTAADEGDILADARAWSTNFARDAFNNHVVNHEHDCTETCIKYAKKRLEAKKTLRSHKTLATSRPGARNCMSRCIGHV